VRRRLTGFLRTAGTAVRQQQLGKTKGGRKQRPAPAPALVIGGTRIEYTPAMDGDADPGEVVWGWVPYADDPSQGKDRPVVVIGRRADDRGTVVVIPLTSRRDDRDPQVPVGTGPWDHEGRPSYARLDRVIRMPARSVRREGAILPRDRFDAVIAGLREHHRDN
jgi:mRNA-degrading endonuclease toxin of MazEF toxin-antitoxin module